MNKEKMIVTTTKFEELRKEFNSDIRQVSRSITPNLDDINAKVLVIQQTIDKLLMLLDRMV